MRRASFWTVHLHVGGPNEAARALRILEDQAALGITGDYAEGSWATWGTTVSEKVRDNWDDYWALRVYIETDPGDFRTAYQRGKYMAALLQVTDDNWAVSTAGDWTEQVDPSAL